MYPIIKHLHLTFVVVSIALLVLRFFWMVRQSDNLNKKWVKILPHVVDTGLLLSAAALCVIVSQYPFVNPWLTEKFLAVIAYIIMGVACFKGRTKMIRYVAFVGAFGWLAMIGKLAVTKTPMFMG